ncbi:hypothetical protein [Streptomyces sp. NPDC003487]
MAQRLLLPLFRLSVLAFLAGGIVIVAGQALGIVLGDAQWVTDVEGSAQPPTCIAASICGILSFALSYRSRPHDASATAAGGRPLEPTHRPE